MTSIKTPYLKNHKLHIFSDSSKVEREFLENKEHLAVIRQLSVELTKKFNICIDFDTYEDNYEDTDISKFRNKAGVDAKFNLVDSNTRVLKRAVTLDYKIRYKNVYYDDFLAEIVSQDFGPYSNKIPVPGWALANHKINDAILYILPYHKKAAIVKRKELKNGFDKNRFSMKDRKIAKNPRYNTISVPISWERLISVCPSTITLKYA